MLGIHPATRVFGQRLKVYGELMEHGEVVSHPKVLDEGDELARRFMIRASAREALEEHAASEAIRRAATTRSRPMWTFEPGTLCFFYRHYPGSRAETAMRGRYLGRAALFGPHGRRSWWVRFGGRAYLCAAEHLRGDTPDEADRLGLDETRQLDELLQAAQGVPENYEDLTSQLGPDHKEKSRDDLDDGMGTDDQLTPPDESGETRSSTEIGGQQRHGHSRAVEPFGKGRRNSVVHRNPRQGNGWKS